MAITITEYPSLAYASGMNNGSFVQDYGLYGAGSSVINTTPISSAGGVSTFNLLPTTRVIRIAATAPGWVLCSASSASTSVVTSTNAPLSPAGTIELRGVKPGSRVTALST